MRTVPERLDAETFDALEKLSYDEQAHRPAGAYFSLVKPDQHTVGVPGRDLALLLEEVRYMRGFFNRVLELGKKTEKEMAEKTT